MKVFFIKKFENICLILVTVVERSIQERIWFVKSFSIFWFIISSAVEFFIDFLTSGLDFVKGC